MHTLVSKGSAVLRCEINDENYNNERKETYSQEEICTLSSLVMYHGSNFQTIIHFLIWLWVFVNTESSLGSVSEPASCLAIANCVYYIVFKEKAFPFHGKMHFHSMTLFLTTKGWPPSVFPRSSFSGIHEQAPKNWRCVSDCLLPLLLQVQQWIQSIIVEFPCLQALLHLGKEKNNSSFFLLSIPSSFSINITN